MAACVLNGSLLSVGRTQLTRDFSVPLPPSSTIIEKSKSMGIHGPSMDRRLESHLISKTFLLWTETKLKGLKKGTGDVKNTKKKKLLFKQRSAQGWWVLVQNALRRL